LRAEFEAEWALMERTLVGPVSQDELRCYKQIDWQAIEDGRRLIFAPILRCKRKDEQRLRFSSAVVAIKL
jgi:hypothetical protein